MILVDTSIWVQHLREGNPTLQALLYDGLVLCHPFVIGELACGSLARRNEILALLGALPAARVAEHAEALYFIEAEKLYSQGLGWIDVHLLASAKLEGAALWTLDKRLHKIAS